MHGASMIAAWYYEGASGAARDQRTFKFAILSKYSSSSRKYRGKGVQSCRDDKISKSSSVVLFHYLPAYQFISHTRKPPCIMRNQDKRRIKFVKHIAPISSRICACNCDIKRCHVGSSAMSNLGLQARAIAITHRCLIPPSLPKGIGIEVPQGWNTNL